MKDKQKTEKLLTVLDCISEPHALKEAEACFRLINVLKDVYTNGYRHTYADIFYKLQEIFSSKNSDVETGEVIGQNLDKLSKLLAEEIEENPNDQKLISVLEGFQKFSDHINLEIGRYNFIFRQLELRPSESECSYPPATEEWRTKTEGDLNAVRLLAEKSFVTIKETKDELKKVDPKLEKVDEKLENNKISSITALTIFSAVVLTFSGGITFLGGVFQGISEASSYRLVFIVALTGFILYNTIFALLYIVGKMTGKTIDTKCKYISSNSISEEKCRLCGEGKCIKPYSPVSLWCKIFRRYTYTFIINTILLGIMYADFILWYYRNTSLNLHKIMYIVLPIFIFILIFIIMKVRQSLQKPRIKLNEKIFLVSRYLSPEKSVFKGFLSALGSNALINRKKDFKEKFREHLDEEVIVCNQDTERILVWIDYFVEEKIFANKLEKHIVSRSMHKANKKQWESLKGKLTNEIKNNS